MSRLSLVFPENAVNNQSDSELLFLINVAQ
jgi:hypothetical protein